MNTAVKVALRVRPLTLQEQINNCSECISYVPNEPQIGIVGSDKSFTFDHVFDEESTQKKVYEECAKELVERFIEGFNVTILAYGQTGSGKTYSMGTGLQYQGNTDQAIVPRAAHAIFSNLNDQKEQDTTLEFQVFVSFLELYNEELIDLLQSQPRTRKETIQVREDGFGGISWQGVKEHQVQSAQELLDWLQKGSLCRTTASTDMNQTSSRSHAIFSVILKQQRAEEQETPEGEEHPPVVPTTHTHGRGSNDKALKKLTSKFHFVDLAGSERLKRTRAVGDRAKEGISINSGLLALGNVISALGDEARKSSHVPYRDSKLTRLLQDSLGGNSATLMLACVSGADVDYNETISTLVYANRARNIRNRVIINQDFRDSTNSEIAQLRAEINRLKMENSSFRAMGSGPATELDQRRAAEEMRSLRGEVSRLRDRLRENATELCDVLAERDTLLVEREVTGDADIEAHPIMMTYHHTVMQLKDRLIAAEDQALELQTLLSSKPTIFGRRPGANRNGSPPYRRRIEPMDDDDHDADGETDGQTHRKEASPPRGRASPHSKRNRRHNTSRAVSRFDFGATAASIVSEPAQMPTSPPLPQVEQLLSAGGASSWFQSLKTEESQPLSAHVLDYSSTSSGSLLQARIPLDSDSSSSFSHRRRMGRHGAGGVAETLDKAKEDIRRGLLLLKAEKNGMGMDMDLINFLDPTAPIQLRNSPASSRRRGSIASSLSSGSSRSRFPAVDDLMGVNPMSPLRSSFPFPVPSPSSSFKDSASPKDQRVFFEAEQKAAETLANAMKAMDRFSFPLSAADTQQRTHMSQLTTALDKEKMAANTITEESQEGGDDIVSVAAPSTISSAASKAASAAKSASAKSAPVEKPNYELMLSEVQSGIAMKEELVQQLEKAEAEYHHMRNQYEEEIRMMEERIRDAEMERERERNYNNEASGKLPGSIKVKYETKIKQLMAELSDLQHKYAEVSKIANEKRSMAEGQLRTLRVAVETLKAEKQRMIKRMKEDAERIKEMNAANDREIQALRRSEKAALDGRKKAEREIELQLQQQQRTAAVLHRSSGAASTAQQANKSNKAVIGFLKKPQTPKGITKASPKRGAPRMSNGSEHKESNIPVPQTKNPGSTRLQVSQKKQVIDRAIYGYISGQHAINVMEDMLKKRERLRTEKIELEQERQRVVQAQEENALANGSEMLDFASEPQYMDDRITMIDAEITYINARIRALQAEAAALGFVTSIEKGLHHEETRDGSTTDEEELMTKLIRQGMAEDAMGLPPGSGATVAFESSIRILRSMDLNESREFLEMLFEDMVAVRSHENGLQVQVINQEKVIEELKRALQAMRRAAVGATLGYEKRCDGLEQKLRQLRGSSEQLDQMIKTHADGSSEEDENDAEVARLNRAMLESEETKSPSHLAEEANGLLSATNDQLWTALPSTARPRPGSAAEAALDVKAKRASTIFDQMYEDAMKTSDEVSPKVGGSAGEFSRILMTNNDRRVSWVGLPNADTAEYLGINQEKEQQPQQHQQHNRLARSSSTSSISQRTSNPEREHAPKPRENMSMYGHRRGSSTAGGSGSGHGLGIGNGPNPGLHRSSSSMNRLSEGNTNQRSSIYASTASSRQHAEVTAARRSSTPVSMPSVGPKSAARPRFNSNTGHHGGNAEQNGLPSPGFHGRTPLTIQTGFANGYAPQMLRHSKSHQQPLNQHSINAQQQHQQQQLQQRQSQNFDRRTSTPSPALVGKRFSRSDLNGDSIAQAVAPGTPQARAFGSNSGRPLSRMGSMTTTSTTTPTATHMMGPLPSPGLHGVDSHFGYQQEQYHTHHHNNSASRRISGSWDDNQNVYERLASVHTQASQARLLATRSGAYASQASAPAGGSMMTSGNMQSVFQLQHQRSSSRLMHRPSMDGLAMGDVQEGGEEREHAEVREHHWSSNSSSSAVSTSSTTSTAATNSPTMQEPVTEIHQGMLGKAEVVPVF